MSHHYRRLPRVLLRLRVLSSPHLCRQLPPITALDLIRILLQRSRLHVCLVERAMPPHRITAIRRPTWEQLHGMRPGSRDPRRQRNKRLRPIMW